MSMGETIKGCKLPFVSGSSPALWLWLDIKATLVPLIVQLIALVWNHAYTYSAGTGQALILCDITTEVLVKMPYRWKELI